MFGRHLRAGRYPYVRPFAAGRSPTRERTSTHPVQNSPCSAGPSAQPVQNSPNTPKKAHFSQFCTSRENFLPHPAPRPPAGRTLYRAQCQTRYKTLPAPPPAAQPVQNSPSAPVLQRFREKVRPAYLKKAFFASFAPAGRIFSRSHPHQAEQGELIRAEELTGRDDRATLKPPTPLFTVDRPRSSHRLYGRHQQRENANSPRRVPPQRNAHPTPPARQTGGRHQQCAGAAHPLCQE